MLSTTTTTAPSTATTTAASSAAWPTTTTTTSTAATLELCQWTAVLLVYKRLFFLWLVVPAVFLFVPAAIRLCMGILNQVTAGYAGLTVLLVVGHALAARWVIHRYNRTAAARAASRANGWAQLPRVVPFLAAAARLGGPWLDGAARTGLVVVVAGPDLSQWHTTFSVLSLPLLPSLSQSVWIAVTAALLGFGVVARFVLFPKPIVRCSTVPLACLSSFWSTLRKILSHPVRSMNRLLVLRPIDALAPGQWSLFFQGRSSSSSTANGSRGARPMWSVTAAQALLAVLLGAGLALALDGWAVRQQLPNDSSSSSLSSVWDQDAEPTSSSSSRSSTENVWIMEQRILQMACILTLLLPLLLLLTGTGQAMSHELDPKAYLSMVVDGVVNAENGSSSNSEHHLQSPNKSVWDTLWERAAAETRRATVRTPGIVLVATGLAFLTTTATATGEKKEEESWPMTAAVWLWHHYPSLRLWLTCWVLNVYRHVLDWAVCTCLFVPRPHLRGLVAEAAAQPTDYSMGGTSGSNSIGSGAATAVVDVDPHVQVIVSSLLHLEPDLVHQMLLQMPGSSNIRGHAAAAQAAGVGGSSAGGVNIDYVELQQSMAWGQQLAQFMLYGKTVAVAAAAAADHHTTSQQPLPFGQAVLAAPPPPAAGTITTTTAPLVQDVLHLAVLGSLQATQTWKSRVQHELLMKSSSTGSFLRYPSAVNLQPGSNSGQPPPIVPIVRALVVLVRAHVEVLHVVACSHSSSFSSPAAVVVGRGGFAAPYQQQYQEQYQQQQQYPSSSTTTTTQTTTTQQVWELPPGLFCAVEWAVRAMAQCIVASLEPPPSLNMATSTSSSLSPSPPTAATTRGAAPKLNWTESPVNILIPTCLETMLALRNSVTLLLNQQQQHAAKTTLHHERPQPQQQQQRQPVGATAAAGDASNEQQQQQQQSSSPPLQSNAAAAMDNDNNEDDNNNNNAAEAEEEHYSSKLMALQRLCDASAVQVLQLCLTEVPLEQPHTYNWATELMAAHHHRHHGQQQQQQQQQHGTPWLPLPKKLA